MSPKQVKVAIEYDFFKVEEVVGVKEIDGATVGMIVAENAQLYNFSIEPGDRPWLQRFVPEEKKAG